MLNKYAQLLTRYSLYLKPGEKLFIRSTTLGEPLVREVYREALKLGAIVEYELSMRDSSKILFEEGNNDALLHTPTLYDKAMREFDAYLFIRAPYNLMDTVESDPKRQKIRQSAVAEASKIYFTRTGDGDMKRSLCQYPTNANAQMAGMSLDDYERFIYDACYLYEDDPASHWQALSHKQQGIVDYLNQVSWMRYKASHTDIQFNVEGRKWINSDGKTNMPSGEVFSAPIEDSVQGKVHFTYPSVYRGVEVEGITLTVDQGKIVNYSAEKGQELLDQIFMIQGADMFGEVAIGTNTQIKRATKNILFDEKIGGTIHMAVGQSYYQCGGKNNSSIHWDMITDMSKDGQIFADGKLIYEKGQFLI